MNLSTSDLRNYRTEFHETWGSYRYMFFRFVVKARKERKRTRTRIKIIIIRNGAKTISLQKLFGRLNKDIDL
jgi:hypothetical protein